MSHILGEGQRELPQPLLLPCDVVGDPILQLGQLLQLLPVQPVGVLGKESKYSRNGGRQGESYKQ